MDAQTHLLGTPDPDPAGGHEPRPAQGIDPIPPDAPIYADDQSDDADDPPRDGAGANGSGVTGLDRKLAAESYRKVLAGQELTVREQTALKRFEKEKEERLRWQYYASIPQKHWREMSGRQSKVINEQALRYGIPFGGATVSLPAVVRSIHDFLADNAQKLARDDDELMQGSGSPALERYREERAAIARLDRLEREGHLVPRDEVREALGRIASILRGAGDTLQRQFGQAAADILLEALDDAGREIDRSFHVPEDDIGPPPPEPQPASAD
jgi:hypothetical protein